MTAAQYLIAGNWKMNGTQAQNSALLDALIQGWQGDAAIAVVVCPPALYISQALQKCKGTGIACGGQDCHEQTKGAYTGNISAAMLADIGCDYVIVGHSERRQYHQEHNDIIKAKAAAAHAAGLTAIICVGETLGQREAGEAQRVVCKQISACLPDSTTTENTVIAYEPVWAIGTGKVAAVADVAEMHIAIHRQCKTINPQFSTLKILYGGSVKADNASAILATAYVSGALVGGASLDASQFMAIANAAKTLLNQQKSA